MSIRDDQEAIRQAKDGAFVPVSKAFLEAGCPMPIDIKPGPELDYAVAKAIGWTCLIQVGSRDRATGEEFLESQGTVHFLALLAVRDAIMKEVDADGGAKYIPHYSTDLNAAFEAAERAGLFSITFWRTLGMDELGETWSVFEQDGCCKRAITGDQHATPALAICASILELKKNQKGTP